MPLWACGGPTPRGDSSEPAHRLLLAPGCRHTQTLQDAGRKRREQETCEGTKVRRAVVRGARAPSSRTAGDLRGGSQGHWAGQDTHQAVAKQRPRCCQGPRWGVGQQGCGSGRPGGPGPGAWILPQVLWEPLECSASEQRALGLLYRRPHSCWEGTGRRRVRGRGRDSACTGGHRGDTRMQGRCRAWAGRSASGSRAARRQRASKAASVLSLGRRRPAGRGASAAPCPPGGRAGGSGTSGVWEEDRRPGPHRMEPGPGGSGRGPAALAWPLARPSLGVSCKAPAAAVAFKAHTFPGVGTIHLMLRLRKRETRDIN